MLKEGIISVIIVIAIIAGNILTQNYTKQSVKVMSEKLGDLRNELLQEEKKQEDLEKKIEDIYGKWEDVYEKMAYYIEHDELEKVATHLSAVFGNVQIQNYEQALPEVDQCVYILQHIKNKEKFMIQNIF